MAGKGGAGKMRRDPDKLANSLSGLPSRMPSSNLRTTLRVIASQERQRHLIRRSFTSMVKAWVEHLDLFYGQLVRSLALPFAGGVFSAVVLFSMCVVPAYPLLTKSGDDVPTTLTTKVAVKGTAPFAASDDDVVVDVRVDADGRMIDYAIISGAVVLANPQVRRRLENVLLFTEFTPATSFGQPMQSKMRLWFRSSHIDVRG
jgi:hypothetical protein